MAMSEGEKPVIIEAALCYQIVGAFWDTFNEMGPGFRESTYGNALDIALNGRGLVVQREHTIEVFFRGQPVGTHRLDRVVNGRVVVELKATERLASGTHNQVRSYLSAARLPIGLILHFGLQARYYRVLAPWIIDSESKHPG